MVTFSDLFATMRFDDKTKEDEFRDMYASYMSGLPGNFYKNQFELADAYGHDYEAWASFLTHPAFDSWKSEQVGIIAKAQTDKALGSGDVKDKDSLNLLKARREVLESENAGQKATIIVLPDSLFYN
jgi:hypothetical protein